MKISRETVRHVSLLARLRLTPEEEEKLSGQLGTILEYVEQLREVPTDDVPPTANGAAAGVRLRPDRAENRPATEAILANAPDRANGFFRVPKIIEDV